LFAFGVLTGGGGGLALLLSREPRKDVGEVSAGRGIQKKKKKKKYGETAGHLGSQSGEGEVMSL